MKKKSIGNAIASLINQNVKAWLFVVLAICAVSTLAGTYCMKKAGQPAYYEPNPPCPTGKDGTGMCFKWITFNDYGYGPCQQSPNSEDQCTDGVYSIRNQELVGMCSGVNCIINTNLVNFDNTVTQTYSIDSLCDGG